MSEKFITKPVIVKTLIAGCILFFLFSISVFVLFISAVIFAIFYEDPNKPDLPIEVTVRKSKLDNTTFVVVIKNNSNKDLQMQIQRTNKSYGEKSWAKKIRVPAQKTEEFGTVELGWKWLPQVEITISHPEYKKYYGVIPELDADVNERQNLELLPP